jgi:two-component system, LytTR family, response regulator LytT
LDVPVIFTTAYDEYALQAFDLNNIDYLLKPIDEELLRKALNKLDRVLFRNFSQTALRLENMIGELNRKSRYKTRFLIRQNERLFTIEEEQVAYFHTTNKIVVIVTRVNRFFPVEETLEFYETRLDPSKFFRLNRSFLAHRRAIREISAIFAGKLQIILEPPVKEEVFVSKEKSVDFKSWLEN